MAIMYNPFGVCFAVTPKESNLIARGSAPGDCGMIYMKKFKYIVFDFDGTLVDSRAVFIRLYNELAAKHGYNPMTAENLEHLRTLSIPERCKYLSVPMYRIPFLAAAVMKKYRHAIADIPFNPGIKDMLEALSANAIPFAVLSSNSKANIAQFFSLHGIVCGDIFCSRSIFGKHVLLNKFLKEKKLEPSDILYVGDELRDIIACRKSGVEVAWVSWGYDHEKAVESNRPDHVFHNPADLLAVVMLTV